MRELVRQHCPVSPRIHRSLGGPRSAHVHRNLRKYTINRQAPSPSRAGRPSRDPDRPIVNLGESRRVPPMLRMSPPEVDPTRDACDSRHQTLVLVLLVWLLGSLLLAGSIFSDVNDWLIGVRGFYFLHVLGHLTIIGVAFSLPDARQRILGQRAVLISVMVYGALVAASTAFHTTGNVPPRLVEALLIPTTIVSLAVCLPSILSPSGYRTLFRIVIVILSVSSIASLVLV